MSQVTTHVLDTATGRPAAGIRVRLDGVATSASGVTDADGRVPELGPDRLAPGTYRLVFEVDGSFFPEVVVAFVVDGDRHYHVPLLLSPHSYTTYLGS